MGLMGYIRSSGRLAWHVNELMPDTSRGHLLPTLGFAAKMVTINMVLFWGGIFPVLGMPTRQQPVMHEDVSAEKEAGFLLYRLPSHEG